MSRRPAWDNAAGAAVPHPDDVYGDHPSAPLDGGEAFDALWERATRRGGGPPPGEGLTRADIVAKVAELRDSHPKGELPTQEVTAEKLEKSVRWVRERGGPWRSIIAEVRRTSG